MLCGEEVANTDGGDTLTWFPTSKGHNVEMIASLYDIKFQSKYNNEIKITSAILDIYYYRCTAKKHGYNRIGRYGLQFVKYR